jgi:hypothetical protein
LLNDIFGIIFFEHQDAGFDLAPLINALNHYAAEYDKKSNKAEADVEIKDFSEYHIRFKPVFLKDPPKKI